MQIQRPVRRSGAPGMVVAVLAAAAALAAAASGVRAQEAGATRGERSPVTQRLVFSLYYYSYQGDPRKPVPPRDLRNSQGLVTLTSHPWESVGPWMSYDRAQWHKTQFQMMAEGGIDVALSVYRGDRASRRGYAVKGLDVMTQALKELRSEGQQPFARSREYPQLGMALDLGGLAERFGGPVDLRDGDVQRTLYGMVRDFFLHVPEEFRAAVLLPPQRHPAASELGIGNSPRGIAYVVRLLGDEAVRAADGSFLKYVNRRFAREFGAPLLWVGTPGLRARVPGLDAVVPALAARQDAAISDDGWLRTASIGPGYDDSSQGGTASIRPRENGRLLVQGFRRVLDARPDWIFVDTWNGHRQGTEIAPTLEYGLTYRDLVRGAVLQYKQSDEYAATFLRATAPRVLPAGNIFQVDVSVQNTGVSDWDADNVAALSYRWRRGGQPVGDMGVPIASEGQGRGETKNYVIGVAPPLVEGRQLPPGEYELEFNMSRREGGELTWFSQEQTAPYRIPVTIGAADALRPYWISSSMPTLTRRDAVYPAQVRLRNDGEDPWKKGQVSVTYRWRRVGVYLKGGEQEEDRLVAEGRRIPLPADLPPGKAVTLEVSVATQDAAGKPLATWSPQDDWCYVLEWDVHDGQRPASQGGGATYREAVEVLDRDPAPTFMGCSLPSDLIAGRSEKITVGLRNLGPDSWKKTRDKIVVHWYYLDGTEASWNDDSLPLTEDVPPFSRVEVPVREEGEFARQRAETERPRRVRPRKGAPPVRTERVVRDLVMRDVPVRVPYYFGPMYCVLDLLHDGLFASTGGASKGTDILVIPVNIFSPTFTPLPISAYFNVDGLSEDVARADGNIDGRGNSIPSELIPPYVSRPSPGGDLAPSPLYPSGLWVRPLNDLQNSRVCFLYPAKASSEPNMVSCQGQRLEFPGLPRTAIHFLGLSTEEDVQGEFTLHYSDGTTEKRAFTFTHWNDAPKHGERAAFIVPHRHTAVGDDPQTRCYLSQYTLPADRLKQLVGAELPRQPAVKILAATLESATLRVN